MSSSICDFNLLKINTNQQNAEYMYLIGSYINEQLMQQLKQ